MANFAESKVFELLLEGNLEGAKEIVSDFFPSEISTVRTVIEKYEDLLDERENLNVERKNT